MIGSGGFSLSGSKKYAENRELAWSLVRKLVEAGVEFARGWGLG